MRTVGLSVALGFALALLATAAPDPVAAAPGYHVVPAGHATRFQLQGTNGYRVRVSANDRRYFRLTTLGRGVRSEYVVRGSRTEGYGIEAKLDRLGVVDVGFRANGRVRRLAPYSNCDGAGPRLEQGSVSGRIRFRGEGGYTSVAVHRVRAEVLKWPRQRCRFLQSRPARTPKRRVATFSAFSPSDSIDFRAAKFSRRFRPAARQVSFMAYFGSRYGPVSIFRTAFATAPVSSFLRPRPDLEPEHLVLTPPPPFTGSATFQRTPESTLSWTGSLAVTLPGRPVLPLIGPDFETSFCVLRACAHQSAGDGPDGGRRLSELGS